MMDFGVGLGAELRFDEVAEHSRIADECGFSHITFVDQSNVSRECFGMMAIAAQNSRRAHIGHGVCDPIMYHPAVIGNFSASLREMTGGRAFVGLGAGSPAAGKAIGRPAGLESQRETVEFLKRFTAGDDAELWGSTWHSEWIRRSPWAGHTMEVWMGPLGPRALALAGEIADQIWMFGAGQPELIKWNIEQIHKGAERAGRDPTKIKMWARTEVYIAESKDAAWDEVASYSSSCAEGLYLSVFRWNRPEATDLGHRLERASPGIMDEIRAIHDNFNPYQHESILAKHKQFATQRIVDTFNLTGPVDWIAERINELMELGLHGVSCVQYAVLDQKTNMREIADRLMPLFR